MNGRTHASGGRLPYTIKATKQYPPPIGFILKDFQLKVDPGEIVAIMGPSGVGKSTLLDLIAGVTPNDTSEKTLHGPQHLEIGYVFQTPELVPWLKVLPGIVWEANLFGKDKLHSKALGRDLLTLVELDEFAALRPAELSVGMRQRLQFAVVLTRRPPLVLLDEPLGAVDRPIKLRIVKGVRQYIKSYGGAAVWVTHDEEEALLAADRVVVVGSTPLSNTYEKAIGPSDDVVKPGLSCGPQSEAAKLRDEILRASDSARLPCITHKPSMRLSKGFISSLWIPTTFMMAILLAWQGLSSLSATGEFFFSTPTAIATRLVALVKSGGLLTDSAITFREAFFGLVLGTVGGTAVGLLAGSSQLVSSAIRPIVIGLSAVPMFVLAPAFILWFGIGEAMKVALAALSCLPIVAYWVLNEAERAKARQYKYLAAAGVPRWKLMRHLVIPATVGALIESIRPAALAALLGAFLGELVAAEKGLGYFVMLSASRYRVDDVLVGVATLFAAAIAIDLLCREFSKFRYQLIEWFRL